jgi:hypothetical protein
LADLCAIDLLSAMRSVDCKVLRSAMDCSMLEIPPLDPMVKGKLLHQLGKKNLEAGLFVRGSAGSARKTNSRLNLLTWSKLFVRFNLVVGWVAGKLLGWFVGFGLGHKIKGFRLGRFMPKPKFKEMMEVSEVTGPVSDPEAGLVFVKCFNVQRLPTGVLIGRRRLRRLFWGGPGSVDFRGWV